MQTPNETLGGNVTLSRVEPGRLLADRFEILGTLGSGGMGVVFKARDRKLDELVALKMLKNASPDQLARFKTEIKLARKISHPNVLSTFDFGEIDQVPFISMEYVRGITLRELLDQSGALPLSAGLHLARQLCRGLGAAHGQGVLHRDIKPENLIIEHTGNAKLMDFGIARPFRQPADGRQTQPGTLIGTPYYVSPEQLQGKEADARADIYACGVVLFEIFTGSLPFSTEGNVMQVMMNKLEQDPALASEHWPEVPAALEQILSRCLSRDPDARYANADALNADLEALRG
jgi:serine/threonine-protein kinase